MQRGAEIVFENGGVQRKTILDQLGNVPGEECGVVVPMKRVAFDAQLGFERYFEIPVKWCNIRADGVVVPTQKSFSDGSLGPAPEGLPEFVPYQG